MKSKLIILIKKNIKNGIISYLTLFLACGGEADVWLLTKFVDFEIIIDAFNVTKFEFNLLVSRKHKEKLNTLILQEFYLSNSQDAIYKNRLQCVV